MRRMGVNRPGCFLLVLGGNPQWSGTAMGFFTRKGRKYFGGAGLPEIYPTNGRVAGSLAALNIEPHIMIEDGGEARKVKA